MSERSGIEIDYCPQCRGVWLDRGELDKIIDRSLAMPGPAAPPAAPPPAPAPYRGDERRDQDRYEDRSYDRSYQQHYRKKRKESWLSELFD